MADSLRQLMIPNVPNSRHPALERLGLCKGSGRRSGSRTWRASIASACCFHFVCHGGCAQFWSRSAWGRRRSAAQARCWTRGAPGACCGCVYCNSVRIDPAHALTVTFAMGRCGGGRRGHNVQLCESRRICSETARRAGQRGAKSGPHRRRVRCTARDRRCASALDASSWTLSSTSFAFALVTAASSSPRKFLRCGRPGTLSIHQSEASVLFESLGSGPIEAQRRVRMLACHRSRYC